MSSSRIFILSLSLIFAVAGQAHADVKGSQDHPMFPRFSGSEIIGYKAVDYEELKFALGKAYEASSGHYILKKEQTVEGKLTRTLYLEPDGKSTLQVLRNYENTLKSLGFSTLFVCKGNSGCGWNSWFTGAQTLGGLRGYALQVGDDFRYVSAKLTREKEGDVYVSLLVYKYDSSVIRSWTNRTMAELNVVEVEPMKQEMVKIIAADMAKGLKEEGHASVHQIYFDTDSAKLKPESDDAIGQIAKLLKDDPTLKIILVGHTDHQGELQYNMDLSHRRAKAVMAILESKYGIPQERLGAVGLGYLAPVASNSTEEGRAKNRRVEIIEQ